jgi:hypothetical protein
MAQDDKTPAPAPAEDRGDDFTPTIDEIVEEKPAEPAPVEEKVEPEVKEEQEEPERDEKGKFVPRERMKEAVEKERERTAAASARAKELEDRLSAQTTSQDIVEAQKIVRDFIKQRNSFLGDGELDKASEVDAKIFELQEAIAERKAEIKAESSKIQAVETMKYDTIVERLENEHPELNPDADEYDDDLAMEMRALMRGYQTELKLTPAQALTRAAKRMFPPSAAAEEKPDKTAETGMRRKKEATEKNLTAAKQIPATTKDTGLDHDKKGGGLDTKTVMNMNYEEFSKLGDDVLSRLRGDSL